MYIYTRAVTVFVFIPNRHGTGVQQRLHMRTRISTQREKVRERAEQRMKDFVLVPQDKLQIGGGKMKEHRSFDICQLLT